MPCSFRTLKQCDKPRKFRERLLIAVIFRKDLQNILRITRCIEDGKKPL